MTPVDLSTATLSYDPNFWGTISNWVSAGATFIATLVALGITKWFKRPRLKLSYEHKEPYLRKTLTNAWEFRFWARICVKNVGKEPAKRCIGKVTRIFTENEKEPRNDKDPLQLRWAGVPDVRGFEPIHISKEQYEYLNVLSLTDKSIGIELVTFPEIAPGFSTQLDKRQRHTIEITVSSDNAMPQSLVLAIQPDQSEFCGVKIDVS